MTGVLDSLYSIRIGVDRELRITEVSKTLIQYMPQVKVGELFIQHFNVHRPSNIRSFEDAERHQGLLFLLTGISGDFAVRGQVVDISPLQHEHTALVFLGAPWVGWLSTNRPDLELNISDFSAQDAQLDQIFLTVTEQQNVKDLRDIAEKLQLAKEEAEESNRIRSDFFAVMNHEMRTPLNGVITALNLLEDQSLGERDRKLYGMAMDSAENLLVVINNVLDFSKLEAGKFEIEKTSFELTELINSVRSVLSAKALHKSVALNMEINASLENRLLGDDSKIRQVLINLASNAIKFTDKGHVSIRVSPVEGSDQPLYRFLVEDTGHGVNPAIREKIFQPFWTEVQGRAEIGTGLGLYICRRLVQMMDGDIEFESLVGVGSRFWFDIPLDISDEAVDADDLATSVEECAGYSYSGRVLLVEDNPTNQALTKMLIKGLGPSVDVAGDGIEAVRLIQSYPYDLVLMDINMPNMGGIEATKIVRENSAFDNLPIVALTAYSGASDRDHYLEMGMNGYLKKPIETPRLTYHLSRWLQAIDNEPNGSSGGQPGDVESSSFDNSQLDTQIFSKLFTELGPKSFDAVFVDFLKDFESAVTRMEVAWTGQKFSDLERELHSQSSCVKTYGVTSLGDRMQALENMIKQTDTPLIEAELNAILQECRALPGLLRNARESLSE